MPQPRRLCFCLRPIALLESYAVSNAVNRVANDSPELIVPAPASVDNGADAAAADAPADPEKADKQLSLF